MNEEVTIDRFPDLRATTRHFADGLKADVTAFLDTVKANFRPGPVFGSLVAGGSRETTQTIAACAALTAAYKEVAKAQPFLLDGTMPEDVEICSDSLKLFPLSYTYKLVDGPQSLSVEVRTPLSWVVAHPEFQPDGLRELVSARVRNVAVLRSYVIQYVALNFLVMRAKNVLKLLDAALRFSARSEQLPEFGPLPMTVISAPAGTIRPPDPVIAFVTRMADERRIDEVLDKRAWADIRDPLADAYRKAVSADS